MRRGADAARRVADVGVAVVGLAVTAPVLTIASGAVRLALGPPVLFRQRRLGRGGRPFWILKLRTMHHAADGRGSAEFDGERLTRLGRFLRATSIDELPSLVNLMRGELTLVGPRPLPVHYWQRFRGDEYARFEVKPGITGLAQVSGRNTVDWTDRLAIDARYVRERTVLGDLRIVARTVPLVLRRAGVVGGPSGTMHPLPPDRDASA